MAAHSSVLAWRIPGTGEPGGLQSLGSHRVGNDWSDLAAAAAFFYLQVLMHSLFTFNLPIWPWRQSRISQIAFASLSKDKKASFGRMFKSPRLLFKKKKKSLKMLVLIQCLWLRHGTMLKGWIWKKTEIKIKWSSANTVVELWC